MPKTSLTGIALLSATLFDQPAAFAQETLAAALNRAASELDTTTAFRLDGYLQKDSDPKRLRLYPDPSDRALYYLIRREDIVEEPYKWADSAKVAAGFAGPEARHRVAIEHGAVVHVVTMTVLSHDELQQESRRFASLSNLMKARAEAAKSAIENLK